MQLIISPERAAAIRLWILIPCRTLNSLAPHHITMLGMLRSHGIWYSLRTLPGDSLVTRARNNLADIFLRESTDDNDHFALWLDDDIIFNPEAVLQLLALNLDFVAAPYTRKGMHLDRMAAAASLGWKPADLESVSGTPNVNFLINNIKLDEPVPVMEAGSGFWLHKRKVLRMMADYLPGIRYRRTKDEQAHYGTDHAHDFFRVGVWTETGEYLSEDWWFCREWRKLGGTVWCVFWIQTQHIGPHFYQMNMDAILGLLNQTGGYIHGETWREKETKNAPTQVRTARAAAPTDDSNGGASGRSLRLNGSTGSSAEGEADQATVASDPSPVGS